jgi:uncharacterized membrane protein
MNRAELKNQAKKAIDGNIFMLLAITLLVGAATSILTYITLGLGALFVAGGIQMSMTAIYLRMLAKKKKPEIEELKFGFVNGNYARGLEGYLRYTIFTALWSMLFVIPGIIKGIAYSQMFYLMADDSKLSAGDAQKKSMEMMDGRKAEYFVLGLSFIPWLLLVCATFGIAVIFVGPYMNATFAAYFEGLKKLNSKKKAEA